MLQLAQKGDSLASVLDKCKNLFNINVSTLANKNRLAAVPTIVKYIHKLGIDAFYDGRYDQASLCSYYIELIDRGIFTKNVLMFINEICTINPDLTDLNNAVGELYSALPQ